MVEAAGIEPASEKPLTGLSSGAEHLLDFPGLAADARAAWPGSFFVYDRFKSKRAVHIYH